MRILIITPGQPRTTGNWVSVNRQRKGLETLGHSVKVVETNEPAGRLEHLMEAFAPDVANLLHAYRSGKPWLACGHPKSLPLVVTLTGTDVHHGLDDPAQKSIILRIMEDAGAIISINASTKEALSRNFPAFSPKLHHVPPAVELGNSPFNLRERYHIPRDTPLFLHPAGIRPVKGNLELLEMFEAVVRTHPCRLLFCGPLLDGKYGKRFLTALQKKPWAVYAGAIPAEAMPAAMREADVILNNSVSEGFSNALQEAACLGIPILAKNIPGNVAAFVPGRGGFLFDTPECFSRQATLLAKDPEIRRHLSRPTPPLWSPLEEAQRLEDIYLSLL